MQKDLHRLDDLEKVTQVIHSFVFQKQMVELWQPVSEKHKERFIAKTIRFENDEIVLSTTTDITNLKEKSQIFCYIEKSKIVFKAIIKFHSKHKIIISMPEYLVYCEQRRDPRRDLTDQNMMASFYQGRNFSQMHKVFNHHASILNLSTTGAALLVNKQELKKYYIGDYLTLKLPTEKQKHQVGKIIHITPVTSEKYCLGINYM